MLVANSFDLWQRDAFFSAAEDVQQSTDIMESAYRTWERQKREGIKSEYLDELLRELQTALGTAKWQLEEFEKAISLSYRNRADDVTMVRHRQFIDAIESQILHIEGALSETFSQQGQEPPRWVNLNEEECDDLAAFLSGTPRISQTTEYECAKLGASVKNSLQENHCFEDERFHGIKSSCSMDINYQTKGYKNVLASDIDINYTIDLEAKEITGIRDDMNCQADRTLGTRGTWSSPDAWKIVIADEDDRERALIPSNEVTPKEKGSKPVFWRQWCGDCPQTKGGILSHSQLRGTNRIGQIMLHVDGRQRQQQSCLHLQFSSVKFKLALMLTILLIVPFVLYLT